ncbi:ketopantoate reductase family protein [Gordonia sp. DT219]|uniref:ketopantoate reductase family protein n=1 Tax=Gordonia sp. DT219 TaxID=3416658 RepID=UPI003CF35A1E
MSRYVIIGAGALGTALAAEFDAAGIDSVVVARGAQREALAGGPLRYARPGGVRRVPLSVIGGPADIALTGDDVLVVAVKAHQAQTVLQEWAGASVRLDTDSETVAAETLPVVTLQNGIDTEAVAARYFATVIGASVWIPANFVVPGSTEVHSAGAAGLVWLGEYGSATGDDAAASAVAADLRRADFGAQVVPDIERWKRAKLLSNLGNAIDVLAGSDAERARAEALVRAEADAVFAAAGWDVADYRTESALDIGAFRATPVPGTDGPRRSTWQSLRRGAGTVETDHLNGQIVLLGKQLGVPTPANLRVQQSLRRLAGSGAHPGDLGIADVIGPVPDAKGLIDA